MHTCDVLVVGGGSAGLAAAVSAARAGAKTILIERHGMLGGMAPAALVHSICGLYHLPVGDSAPRLANPGFATEFAQRLIAAGGTSGPVRMGKVDVLLQQPTAFAAMADVMVRETPGLEVWLHSELTQASREGQVRAVCRGRAVEVQAKTMIDTSGDGVLAELLDEPFEMQPAASLQRPAFIFGLAAVRGEGFDDAMKLRVAGSIAAAVKAGQLSPAALGATFRATGRPGEIFVSVDLTGGEAFDPLDAVCLGRLEMEGREVALALRDHLRAKVSDFAEAYISVFPSRVGIRESRRVLGQYRLETADLETGATFEDAIALATWPMELRETNRGPRLRYPADGRPCEIPLRALRFQRAENLFVAGRCLSCSHEAQASIRVIGTCLATGEAAGFAAASLALEGHTSAERVRALRAQFSP